eukprot:8980535-Ditylum_brightwellii.AAC.1
MVSERGTEVVEADRGLGVSLQHEPICCGYDSWVVEGGLCCMACMGKVPKTIFESMISGSLGSVLS